jgi:uncharacterized SAM-binding protein YcdF (DUF218 family)
VHADAVVVLAGTKARLPVGLRLVRQGYAPALVVSLNETPSAAQRRACTAQGGYAVVCVHAHPFSTRGEAREIGRLARARHWRTVDVVTSQFHVFRARLVIRRCYRGKLRMVGASNSLLRLPIDVLDESAKLAYQETLARGC